MFFIKGKVVHENQLTSFEYALRSAGIPNTNLVLVSSILLVIQLKLVQILKIMKIEVHT